MNTIDLVYQDLLQAIITSGVEKKDRTGTGTKSIFGYQIRHDMQSGFPLLTTKKMAWKSIVTELLWFLRGDTNIKFLVDNDCHIWDGDCYKNYISKGGKDFSEKSMKQISSHLSKEDFINNIKTNNEFAKKWGNLGPIYGKQWRSWSGAPYIPHPDKKETVEQQWHRMGNNSVALKTVDQIANLINDLKTNPDSRRLMVNAWNVGELDQMVLPPCHYGFQVYTRELTFEERRNLMIQYANDNILLPICFSMPFGEESIKKYLKVCDSYNIPTRAISLMWNQRSVDTFLGLPFNIASYGLLLEIIAKAVNMVPDELIGNLGDVHLYSNHVEQAKEQIGRELTLKERIELWEQLPNRDIMDFPIGPLTDEQYHTVLSSLDIPRRTREPYPLPKLNINTEFWPYEGGECGVGALDAVKVFESFKDDNFCKCLLEEDIQLGNYQSHPTIKAPLSN